MPVAAQALAWPTVIVNCSAHCARVQSVMADSIEAIIASVDPVVKSDVDAIIANIEATQEGVTEKIDAVLQHISTGGLSYVAKVPPQVLCR